MTGRGGGGGLTSCIRGAYICFPGMAVDMGDGGREREREMGKRQREGEMEKRQREREMGKRHTQRDGEETEGERLGRD